MLNKSRKAGIFVISGTSGSGKTTLAKRILKQPQFRHKFTKSVSFTTRPKRPGERQGRDYIFISIKEFKRLLKTKKILEYTRYLGYYYGTSSEFLEKAIKKGSHIILCLDLKGALFLKKQYPENAITIFVKPPSLTTIKKRILGRYSKTSPGELSQRMQLATKELRYVKQYDYCVVNENLRQAIHAINNIIKREIFIRG